MKPKRPPVICEPFRVPVEQQIDAFADLLADLVIEARERKDAERKEATA